MVRVDSSEKESRGGPGAQSVVFNPGNQEVEHAKEQSSETAFK